MTTTVAFTAPDVPVPITATEPPTFKSANLPLAAPSR